MYEEMIKLERISKTFNTEPVLKGIDAELHAGEILGVSRPQRRRENDHHQNHHRAAAADRRRSFYPGHQLPQYRRNDL